MGPRSDELSRGCHPLTSSHLSTKGTPAFLNPTYLTSYLGHPPPPCAPT